MPTWQLWSQRVAFTSTAKKKPLKSDRKLHVRAYCATCDRRIVQLPFRIKQPGRNNEAEGELKFKSNLSISFDCFPFMGLLFFRVHAAGKRSGLHVAKSCGGVYMIRSGCG